MTIDGVNIWAFRLGLSEVKGLYDHPARKKILQLTAVEEEDIVFKVKEVTVILVGLFDDYAALGGYVSSLTYILRRERTYSFPNYSKLIRGYVIGGVKVEIDSLRAKITFKITA